jgi:translation initiation factor 2 subunit 3
MFSTLPCTMSQTTLTIRESEVLERQATHLVGTLGHVSEGKSTLVRALTGVKTQRHTKEQERNITIHLGYANCKIWQNTETGELHAGAAPPATEGWTLTAHISWVDCPGHEAYLATMLGGASVMDSAVLVIAANQDVIPQPQTLEHMLAAELMGLDRMAILQNKLDLLSRGDAEKKYDAIQAFTTDTIAAASPVFPASAQHGWGVERVLEWALALPPPVRDLNAPARMTCVRSFDVNRPVRFDPASTQKLAGAVIGGTLERGVLAIGDWLEVRPGILRRGPAGIQAQPLLTRVRGLRCESTDLPYAVPGSLIAIATDLDPGLATANGMVGQRVGVPGTLPPIVGEIVVRLHKLKREEHAFGKHRVGNTVRVCSNVMTTEATITAIDEKKRLTLSLKKPLCLDVGERVGILRFNKDAGRELIEGAGEVRSVSSWADIGVAEGAELAAAPTRTIVWEPMERREFAVRQPAYSEMLDAVVTRKEETLGSGAARLRLSDPKIERRPKHTLWVNWMETVAALDRGTSGIDTVPYGEHLKEWLEGELQTTSNLTGSEPPVLDMRGFWKNEDLRSLLRRYVTAYKRCPLCSGSDTALVRAGRVLKVRCSRCVTDSLPTA